MKRRFWESTIPGLAVFSVLNATQAQDLCSDLDELIDDAGTHFVDVATEANDETSDRLVTRVLPGATYCRVNQSSLSSAYYCAWAFPYRAELAGETFDRLARDIGDCVGAGATAQSGQSVNHPDTYDVRRFQTEEADVSVAIKDKVAMDATYVFVRIHGRVDD
ncbi:MAG: hypothetical protein AAF563_16995 [Pseudomonadota bacterium]